MSKTNWSKLVEELNEERYVLPEGWQPLQQVAQSLQCSQDDVKKVLDYGLKCGRVEAKTFKVWDAERKQVINTVAFKEVKHPEAKAVEEKKVRASAPKQRTAGDIHSNDASLAAKYRFISSSYRLVTYETAQKVRELASEYAGEPDTRYISKRLRVPQNYVKEVLGIPLGRNHK